MEFFFYKKMKFWYSYLTMDSRATVFEFTSYVFEPDKKQAVFKYKTEFSGREPIIWTESILLPNVPDLKRIPKGLLEKLLQSLHIVLGVSYWKFYCATKVMMPYALSKQEAEFWSIVYKKGLGEFFYKNNLDQKISPKFPFDNNIKPNSYRLKKNDKHLVALSGGKDSIVALELLKGQGI